MPTGVAFLEGVVADQMRRHLPGDADQRNGIHQRIRQRRHHVGWRRDLRSPAPRPACRSSAHSPRRRGRRPARAAPGCARPRSAGKSRHRSEAPRRPDSQRCAARHDRSARATIIAAPVIWFGSWLLSVMASSGCAVLRDFFEVQLWEIKKGSRGPMHTACIWMAASHPRRVPGYDYDKQFGNNITHLMARTSQRLRDLYLLTLGSQARAATKRSFGSLAGFRAFGECEIAVRVHPAVIPGREAKSPGLTDQVPRTSPE